MTVNDPVKNPKHYANAGFMCEHCGKEVECIQVAEWLSFCLGNCIKYIWRAGRKTEDPIQDLLKSQWYISREISRLEAVRANGKKE